MKQLQFALLIFMMFCSYQGFSQEHHYWTNQFGSRSALMGGAVVGGVRDTSAGFYNPGALGFVKGSNFSVSADGYKLDWITINNGAGRDTGTGKSKNLESLEPQVVPLLLSGTFQIGNDTLGYSILAKNMSSIQMSERLEFTADHYNYRTPLPPDASPRPFDGEEEYRGQLLYNSKVSEIWAGMSWASQMRHNISVGMTGFLALRNQSFNRSVFARLANKANISPDSIADEDLFQSMDFYHVRGLLKFGVAADFSPLKIGATITSPSISLFGKGTIGAGAIVIDPRKPFAFFLDDRQENLDADYQTPLSLAVGLEYAFNQKTYVAGTVEWFAKQNHYEVMTPNSRELIMGKPTEVTEITLDSKEELNIEDAAESIVNFAVAIEHAFTNKYKGYLSFRTDFETSSDEVNKNFMGINRWDIYHVTAGMTRRSQAAELAVGITYSFGKQDSFTSLANLDIRDYEHKGENDLLPNNIEASADYKSLGVIIGYTYFFK